MFGCAVTVSHSSRSQRVQSGVSVPACGRTMGALNGGGSRGMRLHDLLSGVVVHETVEHAPRHGIRRGEFIDAVPRRAVAPEAEPQPKLADTPGRSLALVAPSPSAVVAAAPHDERGAALSARQADAVLEIDLDHAYRDLPVLTEEARRPPQAADRRAVVLGADRDVHLLNRAALRVADQMLVVGHAMHARPPRLKLFLRRCPVAALMPRVHRQVIDPGAIRR